MSLHYGDFPHAPYTSTYLEATSSSPSLILSISHSLHFIPLPHSLVARSVSDPEWRNSRFAVTIFGSRLAAVDVAAAVPLEQKVGRD